MARLSQNWLDVLVPFSYEYNRRLSGSEISRLISIPQRTSSRYLVGLVREGILRFEERGNNKFYYLDLSGERIKIILNLVEGYKSFVFAQNNSVWKDVKELVNFGTVILFGSQVKGYSTSSSDIDLVIFSKNTKKLKNVLRGLSRVSAQVVSFENFEKSVFSGEVLSGEILKNHVVFGDSDRFIDLCRRKYG
ncbi:MAG: nucleotidyltransferase domain-containing protein [Nanoarchaeota archaeon]|nr:nucleotidyltransferase domain-containing protein [Nanoarchaeota archaeon]